jgi:hypothetical protein
VVVADMLDMPFESESFDLVIEKGYDWAADFDIFHTFFLEHASMIFLLRCMLLPLKNTYMLTNKIYRNIGFFSGYNCNLACLNMKTYLVVSQLRCGFSNYKIQRILLDQQDYFDQPQCQTQLKRT